MGLITGCQLPGIGKAYDVIERTIGGKSISLNCRISRVTVGSQVGDSSSFSNRLIKWSGRYYWH